MTEPLALPSYWLYWRSMLAHALLMTLRRRGVILAAGIVLSPVIIPLFLAFFSAATFSEDGNKVFVYLVEHLYLGAMAPLLALFFGVMLIGEDVESQTIPYLLTRPIPRTSIVLGRFVAYATVSAAILMVSIGMTFAACSTLGNLAFGSATLVLLLHYWAVAAVAAIAYGALAMFLGAMWRHPIIIGIVLIFGWQRIAMLIPGLVDFLTIEKFVNSLLPILATERQNQIVQTPIGEFMKTELMVSAPKAGIVLLGITFGFLAATCLVVRWREYSAARAVG